MDPPLVDQHIIHLEESRLAVLHVYKLYKGVAERVSGFVVPDYLACPGEGLLLFFIFFR